MKLYLDDNIKILKELSGIEVDLVYADMIYEDSNFEWVDYCENILKDSGIFIVQTDYHTVAEMKLYLDKLFGKDNFINWLIYKQEWGGVSKKYFPRKHDDILVYYKGNRYNFYPERIMIPKKTAGTGLDKNNKSLKIPCDVFDDLGNFSTIAKERVKWYNGKNIQWQKPLKLMERLLLPFTIENDLVLDPFMGSGTTGVWCINNNRNFIGIENDPDVYKIAEERLNKGKEY